MFASHLCPRFPAARRRCRQEAEGQAKRRGGSWFCNLRFEISNLRFKIGRSDCMYQCTQRKITKSPVEILIITTHQNIRFRRPRLSGRSASGSRAHRRFQMVSGSYDSLGLRGISIVVRIKAAKHNIQLTAARFSRGCRVAKNVLSH